MHLKRLRILRKKYGYTQAFVASQLNLKYHTYNNYEIGCREPSFDTLIDIAKLYNVSIDYLLGLSDSERYD